MITGLLAGESALAGAIAGLMAKDGPGRHAKAAPLLQQTGLEPRVTVHMKRKALFDQLRPMSGTGNQQRTSTCIGIANALHEELRVAFFEDRPTSRALLNET